ncbi:MAG TPA: ferritin-like domain-containing protein [Vulgatibacter sp.]|nr:ferritin-like domain-containing protein [Vulgatibacter sp.]
MTHKPTDIGMNRTGTATSPMLTRKTMEGAVDSMPQRSFEASTAESMRVDICGRAEPVGTMPPPSSLKVAAATLMQRLQGKNANVLLDLLGQRLAFERTGVRLYEALLRKYDAASIHEEGFSREDLERIRDEELEHFGLLVESLEQLGADPTVMTPSADVAGVASSGILHVLADPRTTFTECLDAILIAELADNAAWLTLADLASRVGLDEMAARFRTALSQEEEHLAKVRHWLSARIEGQLGVERAAPAPSPATPPPG